MKLKAQMVEQRKIAWQKAKVNNDMQALEYYEGIKAAMEWAMGSRETNYYIDDYPIVK